MADIWTDIHIASVLFIFVFLVQWAVGATGSRRVGVLLAIILVYLTVYQHFIIMVLVVVFFFGFAFFETFEQTFVPMKTFSQKPK